MEAIEEPYQEFIIKGAYTLIIGIALAFLFPLLYTNISLHFYNRLLILVQTINFARGETTVERYGKKSGKRPRMPLLDTSRKKLSIEYIQQDREDRTCP